MISMPSHSCGMTVINFVVHVLQILVSCDPIVISCVINSSRVRRVVECQNRQLCQILLANLRLFFRKTDFTPLIYELIPKNQVKGLTFHK